MSSGLCSPHFVSVPALPFPLSSRPPDTVLSDPRRTTSMNTASHSEQHRTQPPVPPILNYRSAEITIEGWPVLSRHANTQKGRHAGTPTRSQRPTGWIRAFNTHMHTVPHRSEPGQKIQSLSWWAWRGVTSVACTHPSVSLSLLRTLGLRSPSLSV